CSRANAELLERVEPGGVGRRFLDRTQPSLEAQLCNLADEIAYNAHDIDDGVRSGLITLEQLEEVALFDECRRETLHEHPGVTGKRLLYESIRRMLNAQVYDVIAATQTNLEANQPGNSDAARLLPPQVAFSAAMREASTQLKQFLLRNLYRHPRVMETMTLAGQVIRDLFDAYCADPQEMQGGQSEKSEK